MSEKPPLPVSVPAQIAKGTTIRHIKSGGIYRVEITPEDGLRMEKTAEPAYGYRDPDGNSPLWVRSQSETEDPARFEIIALP